MRGPRRPRCRSAEQLSAVTSTRSRRTLRVWLPILATLAIVVPLAWFWQASRVPESYSAMDMGYLDYGGGPQPDASVAGHADHDGASPHAGHDLRPITELVADPRRHADVRVELTAAAAALDVGGQSLSGFTLNGTTPGPTITAVEGQLVEVHLRQRVRDRGREPALARGGRAQRHGRGRRSHPGRGAGRRRVHLPVRGRARGQLLVPLAPGRRSAGSRRALRRAGHPARVTAERSARRAGPGPHVRGGPDHQRSATVL